MPRIIRLIEYWETYGKGTEESPVHNHRMLCDENGDHVIDTEPYCKWCKKERGL